jgi:hypothetical protein
LLEQFFDRATTFATLRETGKLAEFEEPVLDRIREAISLLTLSQLGYAKRRRIAAPAISEENPVGKRSYLVLSSSLDSWTQPNSVVGKFHPLTLDEHWRQFQRESFFLDLLRILRREISVEKGWRKDLRNAAILAGQSQASRDVPQAFLWNMIALELLLTRQGDTYSDALPARAEAFLGWADNWSVENFEERIREVYRKRSALVHSGRRDLISLDDLFFTDDLLLNLLLNIVGHHRIFISKEAVIAFSKRVEAEHLLGIDTRVRPKTLQYWERNYSEHDYRI